MFENPELEDGIRRSKEVVKHTVGFMLSDKQGFGYFLKALSTDYKVYTHSVNVVTYAVALAQRAGYTDAPTLRELAIGALLHDVGKSRIDPAILECRASLTEAQWAMMRRHPRFGYEILADRVGLGEIALDIVLHHHERMRGGGYPDDLRGDMISPLVRIVTVVDIFDALTTDRPFQRSRSSFSALSLMRTQVVWDLDPDLFRIFVSLMGSPS
jgi:HD-GYP domain-containing protein (c-di-GMP phosphodiesterase class II)